MISEVSFLIFILVIIALLYQKLVLKSYWGDVTSLYSKLPSNKWSQKFKWAPLIIEQDNEPKFFYISFVKLSCNDEGIFIKYVFPFNCFLDPVFIEKNDFSIKGQKQKYGIQSHIVELKKLSGGKLLIPIKSYKTD